MKEQTALITGASSGFGLLTSIELAKRNIHVIAGIRNMHKKSTIIELCKQQGIENNITVVQLDVTSPESIAQLSNFLKTRQPVDILINNAGYALGGFCEETSLQEYAEQFDTNFFGVIRVTQTVLPYMRKNRRGKIINVSSISGKIGFPGLSPYVSSKFALEGWSESLRLEVKPFGIDVAVIEAGSFRTNIWTSGKKIAQQSLAASSPYTPLLQSIEKEMEKGQKNYGDPQIVASLISRLCHQRELKKLRYPIGKGIKLIFFIRKIIPWAFWEKIFLQRLNPNRADKNNKI